MLTDYHSSTDETVLRWINTHHAPWLDHMMLVFSDRRTGLVLAALFALITLYRARKLKRWPYTLPPFIFVIAFGATQAITDLVGARLIKLAFARLRPCFVLPDVRMLYEQSHSPSMPSLHAANAMAFAVFLLLTTSGRGRYLSLVVVGAALVVGYSRIYLAVHWPSDVLAGYVMGALIATLCWRLAKLKSPPAPVPPDAPSSDPS